MNAKNYTIDYASLGPVLTTATLLILQFQLSGHEAKRRKKELEGPLRDLEDYRPLVNSSWLKSTYVGRETTYARMPIPYVGRKLLDAGGRGELCTRCRHVRRLVWMTTFFSSRVRE